MNQWFVTGSTLQVTLAFSDCESNCACSKTKDRVTSSRGDFAIHISVVKEGCSVGAKYEERMQIEILACAR